MSENNFNNVLLKSLNEQHINFKFDCDNLIEESVFKDDLKKIIKSLDKNHPEIKLFLNNYIDKYSFLTFKDKIRLVKSTKQRDQLRKQKNKQKVRYNPLLWSQYPYTFDNFLRNNYNLFEEIKLADQKINFYSKLNCDFLVDIIKKDIEEIKSKSSYYGFYEIKLQEAAIILAKNVGYKFTDNKIFGYYLQNKFEYEPKIYPIHLLKNFISKQTKNIINILEKFPSANFKPIFDSFHVLVPSLNINKQIYDKNVDYYLIQNKIYSPILIGERNNICYFISFF